MIKLPYGRADFRSLRKGGYYYVDRTSYLPRLEALGETYLIFLRPRRFGKSLWLSTLAHYYGQEHAGEFEPLFGGLYVGQQPTPLANQYRVLHFDFSSIDTQTRESTYEGFLRRVYQGIGDFARRYPEAIAPEVAAQMNEYRRPEALMDAFLQRVSRSEPPLYLLIDEYDHFTNELISFDLNHFQEVVSRQGWVRKFYEVVKTGTGRGTIDRIFMTGVSPVTLDSLTSGFNISTNLSQDPEMHGLMGFTEAETQTILHQSGVAADRLPAVMTDVQRWYNGYGFTSEGEPLRLYNPDMVLFFAKEYQKRQHYPPQLLDTNIASDYGKIRNTFRLGKDEVNAYDLLRRILSEGPIATRLTEQFSFERRFTQEDFLSLLYYLGLLTMQGTRLGMPRLGVPNLVVEKLYFDFLLEQLHQELDLPPALNVQQLVLEMAEHNRPEPLLELVAQTLGQVSNRDLIHLNETGIKMILLSYLHASQLYYLRSEHEAERGYVDLLLLRKPPIETPYQFVFELKHLKQKDAHLLEAALTEGRAQLQRYQQAEELQAQPNLRTWLAVFVGTELRVVEEVSGLE